jgi:hypothetical protein
MPTIPCSNPRLYDANNHQPNYTPDTFPNHPESHVVHKVPFQAIHNPFSHTGFQPQPKLYSGHLSKHIHNSNPYTRYLSKPSKSPCCTPGTNNSLFRTQDTFPIQPPSQSINKIPCQAIHNPNPYAGYQAKPLQVNSHLIGWKTITRHKKATRQLNIS